MNFSDMFPSRFLSADSLEGRDAVVTIKFIQMESVGQGSDAKDKPVIYFHETKSGLVVNKTNGAMIASLYGRDTNNWIGKRIILYPTETMVGSEMKGCIRIRKIADQGGAPNHVPATQGFVQQAQAAPATDDPTAFPFGPNGPNMSEERQAF